MERCLQAVFKGQLIQSRLFLQVFGLCECSPWYELTFADIEDVFAKLGLIGQVMSITRICTTSSLGYQYPRILVEEIAHIYRLWKITTTLPEARRNGRWIDWKHKHFAVRFSIAEGAGLTEIISYALDNTWKSRVKFAATPSNLTELTWPMLTVQLSVRIWFRHAWYCCLQC